MKEVIVFGVEAHNPHTFSTPNPEKKIFILVLVLSRKERHKDA